MSENKCDPILNIKSPEELFNIIKKINSISSNRPLTLQEIQTLTPEEIIENISRSNSSRTPTEQGNQEQPSRSNSSGGSGGGSGGGSTGGSGDESSNKKSCKPKNVDKIGAWNFPKSCYGMELGKQIKPRKLNCNCEK